MKINIYNILTVHRTVMFRTAAMEIMKPLKNKQIVTFKILIMMYTPIVSKTMTILLRKKKFKQYEIKVHDFSFVAWHISSLGFQCFYGNAFTVG